MTVTLKFPGKISGPLELVAVAAPQAFTAAWVDMGGILDVRGAGNIGLYVNLDINNSTDCRVRLIALHTDGGDEYVVPIYTVTAGAVNVQDQYHEFSDDADQNMLLEWELKGIVPFAQFQIQCAVVGATAGQIDAANVVTGVY